MPTERFCGFLHTLKAHAQIVFLIISQPFTSMSLPTN
jgi:hypothetical protein